jgi:hypothetical protein
LGLEKKKEKKKREKKGGIFFLPFFFLGFFFNGKRFLVFSRKIPTPDRNKKSPRSPWANTSQMYTAVFARGVGASLLWLRMGCILPPFEYLLQQRAGWQEGHTGNEAKEEHLRPIGTQKTPCFTAPHELNS